MHWGPDVINGRDSIGLSSPIITRPVRNLYTYGNEWNKWKGQAPTNGNNNKVTEINNKGDLIGQNIH